MSFILNWNSIADFKETKQDSPLPPTGYIGIKWLGQVHVRKARLS